MRSKNSKPLTKAEQAHIERVKSLPCSLLSTPPPSEAHHLVQGQHFTVVALSYEAHRGPNGWHGNKSLWRIYKMTEIDALAVTIERLAAEGAL